jgi:hypothetical protein
MSEEKRLAVSLSAVAELGRVGARAKTNFCSQRNLCARQEDPTPAAMARFDTDALQPNTVCWFEHVLDQAEVHEAVLVRGEPAAPRRGTTHQSFRRSSERRSMTASTSESLQREELPSFRGFGKVLFLMSR